MMDDERLGPPPVEPLSDAAWSRVERGLWSRMDAASGAMAPPDPKPRASRRWWLAVAPLAAVAAALVLVLLRTAPSEDAIDDLSRFVSGDSPSSLMFGDSHIELDARAAVATGRAGGHPTVLLERGAAWFTVAPRNERPTFVVRAGDARVRVVGTRFRVARSEEYIAVEVEHGAVDVQFRGRVVPVAAGERWSSEFPAAASTRTAAAPPEPPAPSPAEPPAAEPSPEPSAPAPAPARTHAPKSTQGTKPGKPAHVAVPAAEPEPAPGSARAAEIDRERVEYERLAALEPRSPDAALAGYVTLAKGTSRWAGLALYAAARLADDRGDPRAAGLVEFYLQRFPDGPNAADARKLRAGLKAKHPGGR